MLAKTAKWVIERSATSFLVARRASAAREIVSKRSVTALDLDYRDASGFLRGLGEADALSRIDLAVLWIHDAGAEAAYALIDALASQPCLIAYVRGSQRLAELAGASRDADSTICGAAKLVTVTLGAKKHGGRMRWLTWDEISDGVIDAISAGESRIVGNLNHGAAANK